jgi:hypothetical protein
LALDREDALLVDEVRDVRPAAVAHARRVHVPGRNGTQTFTELVSVIRNKKRKKIGTFHLERRESKPIA